MAAREYRLLQPLTAVCPSDHHPNRLVTLRAGLTVEVRGQAVFSTLAGGVEIIADGKRCYVFIQDLEARAEKILR